MPHAATKISAETLEQRLNPRAFIHQCIHAESNSQKLAK